MRVLVATGRTQGARPGDFNFTNEGELVWFGFVCDTGHLRRDAKLSTCGCDRAMSGLESLAATTTVQVAERADFSTELLADAIRTHLSLGGWQVDDTWQHALARDAALLLHLASQHEVGTVLGVQQSHAGIVLTPR